MSAEPRLLIKQDIPLPYGSMYIMDEDYTFEESDFLPGYSEENGFKLAKFGAMVFSGYEMVKAHVEVYRGKAAALQEGCRVTSFSITIECGSMLIGDEWVRSDAVIQIDIEPSTYDVTVVQKVIAEDIEGVEGKAEEQITIFIESVGSK